MSDPVKITRVIAVAGGHKCADADCIDVCAKNGWFASFDPLQQIVSFAKFQVELEVVPCGECSQLIIWRVIDGQRKAPCWALTVHNSNIAEAPYLVLETQ